MPDYAGGANDLSLRQAQRNFIEFGTINRAGIVKVIDAKGYEHDADWRPL